MVHMLHAAPTVVTGVLLDRDLVEPMVVLEVMFKSS
jgi:hypothetical protein